MGHKKDVHGKPIRHTILFKPKHLGTGGAARAGQSALDKHGELAKIKSGKNKKKRKPR